MDIYLDSSMRNDELGEELVRMAGRKSAGELPCTPPELTTAASESGTINQDLHTNPTFNEWRKNAGWIP